MAQVVVIAGPSGSGKSRLCRRLGLPTLNLDDFYKDGDDPSLPRVAIAGGEAIVDWDSPESWNAGDAVTAIASLAATGSAQVPTYDISLSRQTGEHELVLGRSPYFLAEGIFAQEVVEECRQRGILADALCVTQHPAVTFVRRLSRDLREHRKPPMVLIRRGLNLAFGQSKVVAHAVALGCRAIRPDDAFTEVSRLKKISEFPHK